MRQTRAGTLSMWKGCAFANTSRNAVFAAQLAREGMTGPAPIFEGEMAFGKLLSHAKIKLSKFGGTAWQRRKERVEAAVMDLASDMIQLQALREAQPGVAFPQDSDWQREFEAAFPYAETPDQLTTMTEIKRDQDQSKGAIEDDVLRPV